MMMTGSAASALVALLAAAAAASAAASLQPAGAQPNPPVWPDTVAVFAPGDSSIDGKVAAAFASNGGHSPPNNGQFSDKRFAFLFKPGNYSNEIPIGYYTQVVGLGLAPTDTVFSSDKGVYCEEGDYSIGGALSTFWRSAENFRTTASHNWGTGKGMMWAVSQAAPLRSVVVDNDLALFEYQPPIPQAGEASGGYMANMKVGGKVNPGSQQQWFTRNSDVASWGGGVWNIVFSGVSGAPQSHCSNIGGPPITTVPTTPLIAEKPYITIDNAGKFSIQVPQVKTDSSGSDFTSKPTAIPFESVYVTKTTDGASEINSKLAEGLSVVISPGIYQLDAPLEISKSGQVLLGLGLATLVPSAGNTVIEVADGVDGVRIAGLLLQAGPIVAGKNSPTLLSWGTGSYKGTAKNPGIISDVFARVGGPDGDASNPVAVDVVMDIRSGNVIGDNFWLWRADHVAGGPVTYDSNRAKNGLVVTGDNVIMYGLAVEHFEEDLVLWGGENGKTYFFQSELPYGVTQQQFGDPGYVGYRVNDSVQEHHGWGIGVYSFFRDHPVVVKCGISVPAALESSFVNSLTVWLNGQSGSAISHVINNLGNSSNSQKSQVNYKC